MMIQHTPSPMHAAAAAAAAVRASAEAAAAAAAPTCETTASGPPSAAAAAAAKKIVIIIIRELTCCFSEIPEVYGLGFRAKAYLQGPLARSGIPVAGLRSGFTVYPLGFRA